MNEKRTNLEKIFTAAVKRVDPGDLVENHMGRILSDFKEKRCRNVLVIGFGKASYQMALSVGRYFKEGSIKQGIIITKYGHAVPPEGRNDKMPHGVMVYEAGHPLPDSNGLEATRRVIRLLQEADKQTQVLFLISGGGSALLVCPSPGLTLMDKQVVTELLLKAGADIQELNVVRKHLSMVKGGRLAEIAFPAHMTSLIISDVIGDKLDIIASGPTAPDNMTFGNALAVLNRYRLIDEVPRSVIYHLKRGVKGQVLETPGQEKPVFRHTDNIIIGNNRLALQEAHDTATSLGYSSEILSTEVSGEACEAGKLLARKARETKRARRLKSVCIISGGETTVHVTGSGKGGRNTELALCFAMEIEGIEGITLLSAGTDGSDGPTDAAGAVVDGQTVTRARRMGLDPERYLEDNNSYHFFMETNSLLLTGPTGTNVMDIQVLLVD